MARIQPPNWSASRGRSGRSGCIADVLNRPVVDAAVGSSSRADLADAFDGMGGAYAAKWGIDEAALVERARKLWADSLPCAHGGCVGVEAVGDDHPATGGRAWVCA